LEYGGELITVHGVAIGNVVKGARCREFIRVGRKLRGINGIALMEANGRAHLDIGIAIQSDEFQFRESKSA